MDIVRLKGRSTINQSLAVAEGEVLLPPVAAARRCTPQQTAAASMAVGVLYNLYIFGLCYEILEMLCTSFK